MPELTNPNPPLVPPPTSEVVVRTLATDVAAIAASGGLAASVAPQGVTIQQAHPIQAGTASHLVSTILGWLAVFLALIVLAIGVWFGYHYLTSVSTSTTNQPTSTSTTPATTLASSTGLATLSQTVSSHQSLLVKPAQTTISFPLIAPDGTLKTRYQLMREGLNKIPASIRTATITPTDAAGKLLSFPGYATAVGASDLMDRSVFTKYIQDDFTLLAVRGQGGFSAAYIFTIKPNSAWLYAEPLVRGMESAPSLSNIFLQLPGTQSSGFTDATISDQPVRTATYENPAGTITYGYFRDRLIIATSQQALDEALGLLCFAAGSC